MLRKRRFTTEDTEGTEIGMSAEKGGKPNTRDDRTGILLSKLFSVHSVSSVVKSFCGRESKMTAHQERPSLFVPRLTQFTICDNEYALRVDSDARMR